MKMKLLRNFFKPKLLSLTLGLLGFSAGQSSAQAPYCSMTYASSCSSWGTSQVTVGTFTHNPACNSSTKYQDYTAQNIPLTAGVSTNVSLTALGYTGVGMAADFNNDLDFEDAGETLFLPNYFDGPGGTAAFTGTVTVPPYVVAGNYRLRIWNRTANAGGANNGVIPCGTGYGYGRYLDYTLVVTNTATCLPPSNVQVTAAATTAAISWTASTSTPPNYRWKVVAAGADPVTAPAVVATATGTTAAVTANATGLTPATSYDAYVKALCSASDSSVWTLVRNFTTLCDGTPVTGVASSSVASVCPTVSFNLVLTGVTAAPGITFQWQSSSAAGGPFTNITGATTATYAHSQSAVTYYRCIVTCTGSTLTSTSNVISVGINAPTSCYCTPTSTSGTTYYITSFSTTGGLTNITNNGTSTGSYNQYLTQSASALMGSTVNFSLTTNSQLVYRAIYIDWNQDGAFDETTEKAYTGNYSTVTGTTVTGSFLVPLTAMPGNTRMRVRSSYYLGATMHACNSLSAGEAEDYTFNVVSPVGVCVNPVNLAIAGAVTPTSASVSFTAPTVGNTPTNFIYQLRTDGTLPGSGATGLSASGTVTASPVNFTTLDPATNYVFYIRTFCSVGDTSVWVSIPFNTTFDTLTPVSLGQFNADVVANGIGTALSSTTNDVDGASFALVAKDFQLTSSATFPTYGVPNDRIIQNGIRKYRLANYTGNNSLRQLLSTPTAAVRFLAPKRANKVYVMGISGSAVSNFNAIVYFTDGTTQTQAMNLADWYTSNTNVVVSGLGRINVSNNVLEGSATGGPRMHDSAIVISTANRNKQIDSIVIQRTGTAAGVSNVMAVSIVPNVNQTCKLPGYLTIANPNCIGGLLSWQGNGVSTNYQISYGPIGTLVNAGTIVSVTGATGANTHQFVNGSTNASLQLYVRAVCGTNSYSDWVGPLEVTLPSTTITPTFTLPSAICSGSTAPVLPTTSNNAVTGTWSPAVVSNTTTGSYTFTPSSSFPCALPVTVTINVSGQITPTFTQVAPFCHGTTAPVLPTTSLNGFSGTWLPATVSNIASGTYTFTPATSSSCLSNATMSITVKPISEVTVYDSICSEELPIVWNGITVTAGGANAATYIVPAANACDSITTLNLTVTTNTNPGVVAAANPSGLIGTGQTVTFTATLTDAAGSSPSYQWHKSGTIIPGATNASWTGVAGTDFLNGENIHVVAEGFNSCAAVQSVSSNILEMQVTVGIADKPVPAGFKLYPNPTSGMLKVEGLSKGSKYLVVDVLGRILISGQIEHTQVQELNLNKLSNGTYLILFEDPAGYKWMQKINKL
ncbi:MAG: hypothetical protein BGO31_20000 [Bacteroidetes bacterium 43-16]|nr:MAG: hypothetical protein BGO31_20000 [Bacteroidetes bacterium 43-16]